MKKEINMSDKTIAIDGWEQYNYLISHFKMDAEHALDTMLRNNQDISFLINYLKDKGVIC